MLTPLASRCLSIAVAPFLAGRYAHQWPEALGIDTLAAWVTEKLVPLDSRAAPLLAALQELATHPSFPFGAANEKRFRRREDYIAAAAQAAYQTATLSCELMQAKAVRNAHELLHVAKAADRCMLTCLTAADEAQVLRFFPSPQNVADQLLPLYERLGLSPTLTEALRSIDIRSRAGSAAHLAEGSFVLMENASPELPKVYECNLEDEWWTFFVSVTITAQWLFVFFP